MFSDKTPDHVRNGSVAETDKVQGILLHVCCAPDGTIPWSSLVNEGFRVRGFFFGSNIHPQAEYQARKQAFLRLAEQMDTPYSVHSYEPFTWMEKTRSLASEKEGFARCAACFEIQLRAAAGEAVRTGCSCLCTTLTISPHKDPSLINRIGREVSREYGLTWIERIWRKNSGFLLSIKESRRLGLYRQNYCGCCYSIWRR